MPDNFNIDDILAEYAGGKKQSSASDKSAEKKPAPQPQGISTTSILKSLDEKDKPAKPKESKPAEQKPVAGGDKPRRTDGAPRPNGERPRRPRPEDAPRPDGERPRRPRPEGAPRPDGERPRRPRPEGAPAPNGERPRRPRPEGAPAPDGTRPRRPRPEGSPRPDGERPRRPRPEGAPAPDGTRPRRPRPEGAPAPDGTRPRRPRPEGTRTEKAAKKPETKEKTKLTDKLFCKNKTTAAPAAAAAPAQTKIVIKDGMSIIDKAKQYRFLFEELTKRDFKKKYKRAVLGIAWSVLSPFMNFLVYLFVFSYLFQHNMEHFPIYIMTGSLMFSFFSTATNAGMFSMYSNSGVMSKIKVPKTIFLLSSNVASIFNFLLTMIVYFIFVAIDGLPFGPHMLLILYPLVCLTVFNIGMGYILSSLFVFFRDTQYLYGIFTQLLTFLSAIFYTVDRFPEDVQIVFAINPVYRYITYVRQVVIDGTIPDLSSHLFCLVAAVAVFALGYFIHRKTEQKFVYYF